MTEGFGLRPISRAGLSALLALAMALATVASPLLGVLGPYLRTEIGLEPASLGLLVGIYAAVSAVVSWPGGWLTDRLGGRMALILVFAGSGIALSIFALSRSYVGIMTAMIMAGFGNGVVNPATNYAIAENVTTGDWGIVAGFKMAGVQVGVFGVGFLVPQLADSIGWRIPVGIGGLLLGVVGVSAVWVRIPPHARAWVRPQLGLQWSRSLLVLTAYSLLVSAGANAALTFLPFFAVDELGATPTAAGLGVAVAGVFAIAGRIFWGRVAEGKRAPMRWLLVVGVIAVVSGALLLATSWAGSWTLWIGAIVLGFSGLSFTSVTTLVLLLTFPAEQTGSASGVVFVGFLAGFGIGPAAFGALVGSSAGYQAGWIGVVIVFSLATLGAWLVAESSNAA